MNTKTLLQYIMAVALLATCVFTTSCHSNEQNYKAAYDKAMDKYKTGIGAETYDRIQAEKMRLNTVINGDSVRLVRMYANVYDDSTTIAKPYNVVVAEFTQQFNAKTMRDRLRTEDHQPSYVLFGGNERKYYVIASGFDDKESAALFLKEANKKLKTKILVPRAWILNRL